MQLRLFFRGRLAGRVNHRQIEMGVRVIRVRRDRVEHFLFGGFLPALLARGDAEIIMRRRALRINAERGRQLRDRLVEFALPIIDDAQRGMRELVLGRQRDCFLEGQLRRFPFSGSEINDAEIRERIKVVRRFRQKFLILLLSRAILAFLKILLGVTRERRQFIRHSRRACLHRRTGWRFIRSVLGHRESALR